MRQKARTIAPEVTAPMISARVDRVTCIMKDQGRTMNAERRTPKLLNSAFDVRCSTFDVLLTAPPAFPQSVSAPALQCRARGQQGPAVPAARLAVHSPG